MTDIVVVKMIVVQYSGTVAKADCEQKQKQDDLTTAPDSAFYNTETGHEHGE